MGKRETVLMIHNPIGPLAGDADVATSLRILACHSEFMPIHCMMHVHAGESENQIKLFGVYANGGEVGISIILVLIKSKGNAHVNMMTGFSIILPYS